MARLSSDRLKRLRRPLAKGLPKALAKELARGLPKPLAKARLTARRARTVTRDPLLFLEELVAEQGDVAKVNLGWRDLVVFRAPADVHEVLVAKNASFRGLRLARPLLDQGLLSVDGGEHKRQRAQMRPAFHHERIRGYAHLASSITESWGARWKDGQQVDMADDMMRLTLDVTGQAVFGPDQAAQAQAIGEALTACLEAFRSSPFAPWTSRWPTPTAARFRVARARVDRLVEQALVERRAMKGLRHDMLAMLLDAEDPDEARMNNKEARDQLLTLLVAGHETTALSLTWAWHLLAQNPAAQEKLAEEAKGVLQGRRPEVEDVPNLPFARQVVSETLRLYPPVWAIGRRAAERVQVGDTKVRKGSIVIVSPYLTHHDAKLWPAPEAFDPGRFGPEAAERAKYAYFPFGGGSRVCLGEQLAWLEAILLLTTLAQRWRVHPVPGAPVERQPLLTLQPRGGLPLRLEAR